MKCSLLTLSTFIDDALPAERHAEVDAHLVGCPRCAAGATTLREEKSRIRSLARVRLEPASAQSLLEQVGITGAVVAEHQPRPLPDAADMPLSRPWLGGGAGAGAALPWVPRRPTPPAPPMGGPPPFTEEQPVPTVSPDVQPDLPFDTAASVALDASAEVGAPGHPNGAGSVAPAWAYPDEGTEVTLEPWESAVPGYADQEAPAATTGWDVPAPAEPAPRRSAVDEVPAAMTAEPTAVEPMSAGTTEAEVPLRSPVDTAPLGPPVLTGPPQRLASASGPRAVWEKARDLVAVRVALARGDTPGIEAATIVTGAPSERSLPPPIPGFERPSTAAALPVEAPTTLVEAAATAPVASQPIPARAEPTPVELTGVRGASSPAAERAAALRALQGPIDDPSSATPEEFDTEPSSWNAFGAAAYRTADPAVEAPARSHRAAPLGRHTKAVRKQSISLGTRVAALMASAQTALRRAGTTAAAGAATVATRVGSGDRSGSRSSTAPARAASRTPFDRRVLAAIGGVAVIFVIALLISHGSPHSAPSTGTARQATPGATSVAPRATSPAAPAATAPAAGTPIPSAQTFGSGSNGFQVLRLRFGTFSGSQRVVVDLGATGSASGSPTVQMSFANPTTLVLTFAGTIPAGSVGPAPSGGVITGIVQSSRNGSTILRLSLARPSSPVAFYLTSPLRFVLDLH